MRNLLYQCSGLGTWKSLFHSWSFFSSQNSLFLALRPENPTCFNSSTVDFPVLETQTCWSEPILWVRDILYHYSGLGSWKRFFCLWLFFSSQKSHFFLTLDFKTPFFFLKFVYSRISNARGPNLLKRANIVSAELFVPLQWTWNMKEFLLFLTFFQQPKFPFSIPKTLKRHFSIRLQKIG